MSRLEEIINTMKANTDEAFDDVLELLKPENVSKEQLQGTFENVLGYDPVTYHDKKEISAISDEIAADPSTSEEVSEYINSSKEELIDEALEVFETNRQDYLRDSVDTVLNEKFDIQPDDDEGDDDDEDSDY